MWTAPTAPTRWRTPPAGQMEQAAKATAGVKEATVNFMMLKMIVEFEEGQEPKAVMEEVRRNCKKVEDDCEIFL